MILLILAPFDWKSTKIRLVVAITHRSKKSIWVMAKILATSELEAKESGIFWHFVIFMVFPMLIFSELVMCPDMDHKIPY